MIYCISPACSGVKCYIMPPADSYGAERRRKGREKGCEHQIPRFASPATKEDREYRRAVLLRLNARNCFPSLNNRIALTSHSCAIVAHGGTRGTVAHRGGCASARYLATSSHPPNGLAVHREKEKERERQRERERDEPRHEYFVPLFINIL